MTPSSNLPYHEKQSMFNQLCLVHAINMLLGGDIVDKHSLDQVCMTLSPGNKWWNPHRSVLGTGNYDVNVAMYVLEELGYSVSFFDGRKSAEEMPLKQCSGLLLNVRGSRFSPFSRHWVSYRQVELPNDLWYLLDSNEEGPREVNDIVQTMKDHLSSGNHILMLKKKDS